ncbi:PorV/PorQ family protein [Gaopeijia maritima]|uniref:PorV/PorQ family protein n=1 Tax=Gaopeijia maritima TaxID=3119007 RepID=UPI00325502BA
MSDRRAKRGGLLRALGATALMLAAGMSPLQGQGTAQEGGLFLLLPTGARGVAMGRAMTAMKGPETVWWNPAGIASESERRFQVHRGEDLAGDATSITAQFVRSGLGVLSFSYQLTDVGDQIYTDDQQNELGVISHRNHVGVLTAASELIGGLAAGVNLKLVQQRFTCRGECDPGVTATSVVVDAGVQWDHVFDLPLRLAATVAHAGPRIQFFNEGQSDPLPTRYRLAAAYDVARHFVDTPELKAVLTVEREDRWHDGGSAATYIGTELGAGSDQALFVRAGYVFGGELQLDGAAVGVGIRYDRIDLGIAKSLATTTLAGESEPVQVTLGVLF